MPVVDVITEILIEQAVEKVAAFSSDPDNGPLWYVNIKSVEWKTERPLRVGSKFAFVAHFLGRRMAYTYEVAEWIENERFVMRTADGPFPMETTYTWSPTKNGGTRMTLRNRGNPSGFSRFVAPFVTVAMRRANRKDLRLLKRILEEHQSAD